MILEKEIKHLSEMTLKMAELVLENLKIAMNSYYNYKEEEASLINDNIVDMHERLIEELCLDILLKEKTYARDLRFVSGILKLVGDLERLGDHAEDIRDFSKKLKDIDHHNIESLNKAYMIASTMVLNSITSFTSRDISLANDVILNDEEVDSLYEETLKTIIKELKNGMFTESFAVYTTLVIKYIERIADHAVNIAEWSIYILNGYYKDKQIF